MRKTFIRRSYLENVCFKRKSEKHLEAYERQKLFVADFTKKKENVLSIILTHLYLPSYSGTLLNYYFQVMGITEHILSSLKKTKYCKTVIRFRSSRPEVFCEKVALKSFAKFTGKHLGQSLFFNPLSANPTKWPNTLKQFVRNFPTNCLSVFDHFVKLALKGLIKLQTGGLCTNIIINVY